MTPGRSGYSKSSTSPSARRSKLRPLISTSFSTCVLAGQRAGHARRRRRPRAPRAAVTRLRWFGLSGSRLDARRSTPRSSASARRVDEGDLAPRRRSANTPRRAASGSTETSSSDSSPRTRRCELGGRAGQRGEQRAQLLGQRQPRPDLLAHRAAGDVDGVGHEVAAQRQRAPSARRRCRRGPAPPRSRRRGAGSPRRWAARTAGSTVVGSVTKTSMPAPPTCPERTASASASSSTARRARR